MTKPSAPLTRHQEKLLDASTLIRSEPPQRLDFLHTIQCQLGLPNRNPGDKREWDRKQGNATLRIEAGSAIDPNGNFVHVSLPYGEKPRLVISIWPTKPSAIVILSSMSKIQ